MVEISKIKTIKAREILDSNQKPTIEVELKTESGKFLTSVPSGISTGKYEAANLGIKKAIENIERIIVPTIEKEDLTNQKKIDGILIQLDGTQNKSRLGANAILSISVAACRAGAKAKNLPLYKHISEIAGVSFKLPKPSFNMIEGGKHAGSGPAFQEFMVIPQEENFRGNLDKGKKIFQKLKKILEKKYKKSSIKLSAEGAFSAPIRENSEALDLILEASEETGEKGNVKIAIDAAASEFVKEGAYQTNGTYLSKGELLEFYKNLMGKYPIILIEDPFQEEDFESFAELKKQLGDEVLIFGDDLTASNVERINLAKENNSCSGLVLKPNQIGTVSETITAAKLAKSFGWKIMVANRGGETEDDFIADLAAGIGAEFIKSGAPFPKERMAKYNRLLAIEKEIKQYE